MPYTHHWYDKENGIIQWNMTGKVDWSQLSDCLNSLCAEIEQAGRHVDMIVMDEFGLPNGNPIPHIKRAFSMFNSEENLGQIIVVAERKVSALVKPMTSIAAKLAKLNFPLRFVSSIEEALEIIEQERNKVQ